MNIKIKLSTAGLNLKTPRLLKRLQNPIILLLIFLLALTTRTYQLNTLPYFPQRYPWLGSNPPGLYRDETGYLKIAQNLFENPTLYQPPLFLLFINLSLRIFSSPYSARLPSALASSITAALIYATSKKLFKNQTAAILSALYYTAMTPAFIYNRMILLENGVTPFLLAMYYSLLKYKENPKERWLYSASILAALSTLSKINGVIAPFFLLAYSLQKNILKKTLKPLTIAFSPLAFVAMVLATRGSLKQWWMGMTGRETSAWQFLIINSMPSRHLPMFLGYLRPEYWYLFTYFTIAYLATKEKEKVTDTVLMILLYISLCLMMWGLGSYHLIILQPFFALPVGQAVKKMLKMHPLLTAAFILFIYAPMTVTFNMIAFTGHPFIGFNNKIYTLKILTVGGPLTAAFWLSIKNNKTNKKWRTLLNAVTITLFLTILITGSYLIPAFYPHYFSIKNP